MAVLLDKRHHAMHRLIGTHVWVMPSPIKKSSTSFGKNISILLGMQKLPSCKYCGDKFPTPIKLWKDMQISLDNKMFHVDGEKIFLGLK